MKTTWLGLALFTLLAGCSTKPCETSSQCGGGQVCAEQRCQLLSCDKVWYANDPSTGDCRPLPACDNREDVRDWTSCNDPCTGLNEKGCIADPRCQPAYSTNLTSAPAPVFCDAAGTTGSAGIGPRSEPFPGCGGPSGDRVYQGCRGNPMRVDPCAGKDELACKADLRCVVSNIGIAKPLCDCAPSTDCFCGDTPPVVAECRVKQCTDFNEIECAAHPECQSPPIFPGEGDPTTRGAASDSVVSCFPKGFGCSSFGEAECLQHGDCHPVGATCYCPPNVTCVCGGGKFLFCEPDDGVRRCDSDSDCAGGQRCNKEDTCSLLPSQTTLTPPVCSGLCVPKGCPGNNEKQCNADPVCHPIYSLNCSPYGQAGGGGFAPGVPCGGPFPVEPNQGAGAGAPLPSSCGCEPTFSGCVDADPGSVVDPDKTVLCRDPAVIDQPAFAFANVMQALAGGNDPAPFVTSWLSQLGNDASVDGKLAKARTGAGAVIASLPRRSDGLIDVAKLDFQVTSLSNRIDLAGPADCGEARITYALRRGVDDRRTRMTVIVELRQPDDSSHCQATARKWIALSPKSGVELAQSFASLYAPLLKPQMLNQLRTNEFLVAQTDPGALEPWELREFHLGTDGLLHLSLSKQAVDPALATTQPFRSWALANSSAILDGSATVPAQYLAVTSSENGSRLFLGDDPKIDTALNKMACAGCHTTESNTAFAHVAERFKTTGRAQVSEFLRKALPTRSQNLFRVSLGLLTTADRAPPHSTH